jgi:hypothetical protein
MRQSGTAPCQVCHRRSPSKGTARYNFGPQRAGPRSLVVRCAAVARGSALDRVTNAPAGNCWSNDHVVIPCCEVKNEIRRRLRNVDRRQISPSFRKKVEMGNTLPTRQLSSISGVIPVRSLCDGAAAERWRSCSGRFSGSWADLPWLGEGIRESFGALERGIICKEARQIQFMFSGIARPPIPAGLPQASRQATPAAPTAARTK